MEVPRIRTQTTDCNQYEREMKGIRDFIENKLMCRLLNSEIFSGWKHWQVVYQLEVLPRVL